MNNITHGNNCVLNAGISIVIPCYNESNNIENTYHQLCAILSSNDIDAEVIFIDDGSTDDTLYKLVNLSKEDLRVKYNTPSYPTMERGKRDCKYNTDKRKKIQVLQKSNFNFILQIFKLYFRNTAKSRCCRLSPIGQKNCRCIEIMQ